MKAKWIIAILGIIAIAWIVQAADEITTSVYLKGEKGYSKVEENPGSLAINWNGRGAYYANVITGTTAYVALLPSSVLTNGIVYFRNLSTGTTWTVSFNGGTNDHLSLKPGEFSLMRLVGDLARGSVMGKGGSANTEIKAVLLED